MVWPGHVSRTAPKFPRATGGNRALPAEGQALRAVGPAKRRNHPTHALHDPAMHQTQGAFSHSPLLIHAALQHIIRREGKRSNTMSLFLNLFPRRKSREARELEYLNGSVSLYDLECREREIAQGKFAGF
jgi:hypothetical protein